MIWKLKKAIEGLTQPFCAGKVKRHLGEPAFEIIFDRFSALAHTFNASNADSDLEVKQLAAFAAPSTHSRNVILRGAFYNRYWALSLKAVDGEIFVYLLPVTSLPRLTADTETAPSLRISVKLGSRDQGSVEYLDSNTKSVLTTEEMNGLILACFNDLVKRSYEAHPSSATDIRLILGEKSLTGAFKQLVTDNHRLAADLLDQNEQIRNEIMMELHDDVLGDLMLLQRYLRADFENPEEELGMQPLQILTGAMAKLRQLCTELTARDLADWGLEAALVELVSRLSAASDIAISIDGGGLRKLDPSISLQVYRIIQECTNNAIKHAQATQITITLRVFENEMEFEIADDGKGLVEPLPEKRQQCHNGLRIIRERLKIINNVLHADLTVDSAPGQGTKIALRLADRPSL